MNPKQPPLKKKTRIALWTPLPPLKTGIADYVAELLPYLDTVYDLEIFVDDSYIVAGELTQIYKIFPWTEYESRAKSSAFDLNIYQMGNNEHHIFIYRQALAVPGLVVLHDLSLSYMLYHHYAGLQGNLGAFKKEFLFSEGESSVAEFDRLYNLGDNEAVMELFSDRHMLRRLVGRNFAVLSHLEYCAEVARKKYGAARVYHMYLGSPDPLLEMGGASKEDARAHLGIANDAFLIGVFGHVQPNKQSHVMIRALARIKAAHPSVQVAFVGQLNPALNYDQLIKDLVHKLGLDEHVRFTGFVSREDMQRYYLASDLIVNLRYPSFGQMSATLSRGIATGRPSIITDLPEWRFFPETFCWRVPADDTDGNNLAELIVRLKENPAELKTRSEAAREFYLRSGTTQKAAENLQGIIRDILDNAPKEVTLEAEPFNNVSRSEIVNSAFESWDRLRAGGRNRYIYERIRKIPFIGPLLFAAAVFLSNLFYAREIRRAEWALQKNIVVGISAQDAKLQSAFDNMGAIQNKLEAEVGRFDNMGAIQNKLEAEVGRIEGEIGRLDGKFDRFDEEARQLLADFQRLENETRTEYLPEPVRVWDNPLGEIEGYRPRKPGDSDTDDAYYIAFERVFRGSVEIVRERQKRALAEIEAYFPKGSSAPILDVGCGRGEFLSLLREAGENPIGLDTNRALIAELRQKGFDARAQDVFEYFESIPDGTFKGIVAFHVIEHFTHQQSMTFLSLSRQKLIPGGFIYLETPNPLCPDSLGRFYTDHTHQRPIQPFQLSFLLEYNFFENLKVLFLEPVRTRGSLSSERWISLYQDYGIVAAKPKEFEN